MSTKDNQFLSEVQQDVINFSKTLNAPNFLLYGKMGTGKTVAALKYIREYKPDITLVVCPHKVIDVWDYQVTEHKFDKEIRVLLPDNWKNLTVKQKVKFWNDPLRITTTDQRTILVPLNYDIIFRKEVMNLFLSVLSSKSLIILDESHRVKNSTSAANKAIYKLIKKTGCKRLLLTGTPDPNSLLDYHGQIRLIDDKLLDFDGTTSGKHKTHFESIFGRFVQVGSNRFAKKLVGINHEDWLVKQLSKVVYKTDTSKVRMPSTVHTHRLIDWSSKEARLLYDSLKTDYTGTVKSKAHEYTVYADNVLDKMISLQRIAGGILSTDKAILDGKPTRLNRLLVDDGKLSTLLDILQDTNEPVVVFYRFTDERDSILDSIETSKVVDYKVYRLDGESNQLDQWNKACTKGSLRNVLLVQMRAGGEGVDLTTAGLCILYSLEWNRGLYDQAQARLARPNSLHETVRYIHLIRKGTIDEDIYKSFDHKMTMLEYWTTFIEKESRKKDGN